jgi:hypothetical protein
MNPSEPTQSPVVPPTSNSSPQNGRKKWLLVGGIVLAVVIILGIVMMLTKHDKKGGVDTSDTSVYYDRNGYDRATLKKEIGDPMAIKMTPRQDADSLTSGTVIIPACSVLTVSDIEKAGYHIFANNYGFPIMQSHLSDKGNARFAPDLNNMPGAPETMSCQYGIPSADKGKPEDIQKVGITVNQPFTVAAAQVDRYIDSLKYQPQADMSGYQVFKRDATEFAGDEYLLRKDGNAITVELDLKDTTKAQSLLKAAIQNLDNLKAHPKGYSEVSYSSPVFTGKVAKACDYIDNSSLKQLAGTDASPLVRERWSTAVGVADFSPVSSYKTVSNYVRNQCEMTANTGGYVTLVGTTSHNLQVTTTSYENEQAALQGLVHITVGDGNDSQKVSGVGQEAYLFKDVKDHQNTLAFRQGKVVVEVLYDFAKQTDPNIADLNQYGQTLTPVAQKIAAQLKQENR